MITTNATTEDLKELLRQAANDLQAAVTHNRTVMYRIGALARAVDQLDPDDGIGIGRRLDLSAVAAIVGLDEHTVRTWRAEVQPDTGADWHNLSGRALIELHLEYGRDGHDEITAEMHARYPHLAGYSRAIDHLNETYTAGKSLTEILEAEPDPSVTQLEARYVRMVEAISAES